MMVLHYCVSMETYNFKPYAIGTQHIRLLIQSLRMIHALYGYPTETSTHDSGIGVNLYIIIAPNWPKSYNKNFLVVWGSFQKF